MQTGKDTGQVERGYCDGVAGDHVMTFVHARNAPANMPQTSTRRDHVSTVARHAKASRAERRNRERSIPAFCLVRFGQLSS